MYLQVQTDLVMQDLGHSRRRKKRSVLSKFAASSKQNSLTCTVDSLDSAGDDQTSRSDDFGLNGSQPESNKPKHSHQSEADDTRLDDLNDYEDEDELNAQQDLADSEKARLDDLKDDDYSGNDDVDSAARWSPAKSPEDLKKHDPLTQMDDLSPKLSPAKEQQHQSLNGGNDIISDSENEDLFDSEDVGATAAVAKHEKHPVSSLPAVPPLSTVHETEADDDQPEQADSATFTLSSAVMKVYGLLTRSSQVPSESSIVSGSVTKISTKDARNRFVSFYRLAVFY